MISRPTPHFSKSGRQKKEKEKEPVKIIGAKAIDRDPNHESREV